jgi:hypothetical protein
MERIPLVKWDPKLSAFHHLTFYYLTVYSNVNDSWGSQPCVTHAPDISSCGLRHRDGRRCIGGLDVLHRGRLIGSVNTPVGTRAQQ